MSSGRFLVKPIGSVEFFPDSVFNKPLPEFYIGGSGIQMSEFEKPNSDLINEIKHLTDEVSRLKELARQRDDYRRELLEYRDLLEFVPEIIFRISPEGRFTYINNSVKSLGYEPDELIGKHFDAIVHPDDLELVSRDYVLPALKGKNTPPAACPKLFDERRTGNRKTDGLEVRLIKKGASCPLDSEMRSDIDAAFVQVNSSGRYDRDVMVTDKQFLGTIGIIRNIHPARSGQMDRDPVGSEVLASVVPDVVYRLDSMGRFTFVNDAVRNLGYEPEELLGKHFTTIIPEEFVDKVSREKVLPRYRGVVTGDDKAPKLFDERRTGNRRTTRLEVPIVTKSNSKKTGQLIAGDSNSILGEVTASGYYREAESSQDKKFLGTVGIIRDVTSRYHAEQDLLKKNRELDDFAYMVSHDLKSPLKIIQGFLVLIQENPRLFDKYFPRIINQSNKMINLVDSLLRLSRAGRVLENIQEINIEKIMRRVFVCMKPDKAQGELQILGTVPRIKADPARLEEVFANLVENSFKYCDPNKDTLKIDFSGKIEDDHVLLIYTDNGMGIKGEHIEEVFRPGFVLDRDKGTGFGLAIIRKIISAHSGKIWADSKGPGYGTTFYIKLPLTA